MDHSEWLSVGRIRDAHGIKGEIFIALKAKQADWLEDLEIVRVVTPLKEKIVYEVVFAKPHKDGLIARLEGMKDRNQAEAIRGSFIEIPLEIVTADEDDDSLYMGQYLDMLVEDKTLGNLGRVVGLGSNGPQDLLTVETAKGRFDIPLVDAFILELNLESKQLKMDLPPGLVEV